MEGELELFPAVLQPVGTRKFPGDNPPARQGDNTAAPPASHFHKLFGKVREKFRAECHRHGRLGANHWIRVSAPAPSDGHDVPQLPCLKPAGRAGATNTIFVASPCFCLTCFRPFAKKSFPENWKELPDSVTVRHPVRKAGRSAQPDLGHPTCKTWKVHSSSGFHFQPGIWIVNDGNCGGYFDS